ncbi:molybdenum cofactor guanylyltransferase [Opitutus terrae]|uniref:Probable molybdenum cofactor guanylyltransferase n=1 Tax=Opitutus terrae (strain DSM 11246 / JCM 15787 / PB90-1) TaxID=452637 RepID=MOBA_OPITP|nr:molybdenum cofactor guanylyltransferase [Opitutus terrae]B1ZVU0.1 RecName: Full=Probable molybdenum cofactor guanylyltransferase; Short=MoCo guanylyltransferase; AltName: Full=GTP:molybdopterin guanylyltransferase; AltName: Full=Mo-MPT guanylyltransferase; AltName: Full=Molybdopterin guanylyltransferase; AltName: Full=Molybdopterin-guanine dinucleotide synthase; Short=MGD synthase [Opitutus terrae PB90-1]ACB75026.1 Molybdopterin-guanine dinucleotide biosynthesis protein A-like protein [Opitutu
MSANASALAGAVLAGGESRRMGRDKARLRLRGETLAQRQVRVLREAGAEPVVIVRRAEQRMSVRAVEQVCDEFVGAGPLAGVQAALKAAAAAGARWIAVLAVDMPAIEAAWFGDLRRACRKGKGAVVRHADGFEPLAAIYPINALATAERRLRRGERSMQRFVAALVRQRKMRVVALPEEERWRVANWNRPEDRDRERRKHA